MRRKAASRKIGGTLNEVLGSQGQRMIREENYQFADKDAEKSNNIRTEKCYLGSQKSLMVIMGAS